MQTVAKTPARCTFCQIIICYICAKPLIIYKIAPRFSIFAVLKKAEINFLLKE
jgi:hypothetical protein